MRHPLLLSTATYLEHGQSGAPILSLVKVTASSILQVVILSSVGYVLARRGIIDKRTQTKINKLNVSFFTPALLFSKVAFTLNPARLAELIIVPLGFVIVTLVSTIAALILSWTAGLTKSQRNFAVACAISPNSNSLPVALMQSLVVTVPQLHWDEEGEPEDTVDGMLGRALTYLVLFSTLGMFLRWSVGAKLLSSVEESPQEEVQGQIPPQQSDPVDHANHGQGDPNTSQSHRPQITLRRPTGERRPERKRSGPPAWARSFPNSPTANQAEYNRERNDDSDADDEPLEPYQEEGQITLPGAPNSRENRSCWTVFKSKVLKIFYNFLLLPIKAVAGFMTAPLYAAVISLVVALIPPLQKFVDSLEPVVGALETAGACSIPLTMVVLGAYFVADTSAQTLPKATPPTAPAGDTPTHAPGPQPTTFDDRRDVTNNKAGNGNVTGNDDIDDPWRRTSLDSSVASGESTLVQAKDNKRKGLGSWIGKNPWNSGSSSSGASDVEDGRLVQEPGSMSDTPYAAEDPAARNADLNSRNAAGRRQNALSKEQNKVKSALTMERRTIAVAISSRMILTPLVLLPVVAWYALATGSNVMDDPVFVASACLIIGSPPALTLAQITSQSAQGNPSFERLISKTIFASYAFLAAPTTIGLVLTALVITQNDKNK